MSVTTTKSNWLQDLLNKADLNTLADVLRKMFFGWMMSVVKDTVTGLAAAAAVDITAAATKAAATIAGINLDAGQNLPALGRLLTLRVTASGTAGAIGTYILTDTAGTVIDPGGVGVAVGCATLSDDGTTITFGHTVTAFILEYVPRAAVDPSTTALSDNI